MKNKVLESFILSVIKEQLSSPVEKASNTNFACSLIEGDDEYYTVTIYDPQALEKAISKFDNVEELSDYFIADFEKKIDEIIIVASVDFCKPETTKVGQSWDAFEVATSASHPKYRLGPVAYDIAMYYASKYAGGLMSDRKTVSSKARSVWKKYLNDRPDVQKKEFDDKNNPRTETKVDDSKLQTYDELNHAYQIKQKPQGLDRLENNHKMFLQTWHEKKGSKEKLDTLLVRGGDMLFNKVHVRNS